MIYVRYLAQKRPEIMTLMTMTAIDNVSLKIAEEADISTYDFMDLCSSFPGIRIGLSHRHNLLLIIDNVILLPLSQFPMTYAHQLCPSSCSIWNITNCTDLKFEWSFN